MEIKYVIFDIADQKVTCMDAYAWHNFIADAREMAQQGCLVEDAAASLPLDELFDYCFGDEFWYEEAPRDRTIYAVGFDLCSEEFIWARSERDVEFYNEMALDGQYEEEVFWAE